MMVMWSVLFVAVTRMAANAPPAYAGAAPRPLVVALGDSITYGWRLPHPPTQNYAALYARRIGGNLADLAVPGYTCADIGREELPRMPPGAAIVILNCGTNDIGGFGAAPGGMPSGRHRVPPATQAKLQAAQDSFRGLLSAIRQREPHARIIAITVRHWQRMTGPEDPRFALDVTEWNAMIRSAHVAVADIAADPRMYQLAFIQPDLLHPNVAGNAVIADDTFAAMHSNARAAAPRSGGPRRHLLL
jgi:lysophospholipase L1-like esterase